MGVYLSILGLQSGDMKRRPGNGIEGVMVCTSLVSLLRPLFYFLDDVSYPHSVQGASTFLSFHNNDGFLIFFFLESNLAHALNTPCKFWLDWSSHLGGVSSNTSGFIVYIPQRRASLAFG